MIHFGAPSVVSTKGSRSADSGERWFHLTDRARFKLDPTVTPVDNAVSIEDRSGRPGIYLGQDVERWVNGFGYWRPFVAEFWVDPSVKKEPGTHGRWGGELFVPAALFDRLELKRVIPLDAHCRETYGDYGWIEETLGRTFDIGAPIPSTRGGAPLRGYRYLGPDVREMPLDEVRRLKADLRKAKR